MPTIGKILQSGREPDNSYDSFGVAIIENYIIIEVAIGPVTGCVLQSYRSGSHVKLNLEARAQYYKQSPTQSSDENICFVYSNPLHIIEIHGTTKLKYNYCLKREKFRWLLLHIQMIAGVGLLVVMYP